MILLIGFCDLLTGKQRLLIGFCILPIGKINLLIGIFNLLTVKPFYSLVFAFYLLEKSIYLLVNEIF